MSIATTIRLDEELQEALNQLSSLRKVPKNKLVNEALAHYLQTETQDLASELDRTLRSLEAYQQRDPDYSEAIKAVAVAEGSVAPDEDPAEGQVVEETSSLSSEVEALMHG